MNLEAVVGAVLGEDVATLSVEVVFLVVECSVARLAEGIADSVRAFVRCSCRRYRCWRNNWRRRRRDFLAAWKFTGGWRPLAGFLTRESRWSVDVASIVALELANGFLFIFCIRLFHASALRRRRTVAVVLVKLALRTAEQGRTLTLVLPHASSAVLAEIWVALT